MPVFAIAGEGAIEFDPTTTDLHATGEVKVAADKLGVVMAQLAPIGSVSLTADFDLARHGDSVRVERLATSFSALRPVGAVNLLQPFEFNTKTGELKVADPARELLGLTLQGMPLSWTRPWSKDFVVSGGDVRGEFVAIASNGGFAVRPKAPLVVTGLSLAQAGKSLVSDVDLSFSASADYTPQGWQAELAGLTASSGSGLVLGLDVKAGRLLGRDQPIKAAGRLACDLPSLLAEPVAAGPFVLTGGTAAVEFAASLGDQREVQAKVRLSGLVAGGAEAPKKLPVIAADVRADVAPNGTMTLNVPLLIEVDQRKSDLTFAGTISPGKSGLALDAHLVSDCLIVEDAQLFSAVLVSAPTPAASPMPAARDPAPPWAGVSGRIALALKKVVYSDLVQVSEVTGTLKLDAGSAQLVNFRGGLGSGADARVDGGITFDAKTEQPYALTMDLSVNGFDPAPLFAARHAAQGNPVEGKFTLASQLKGRATRLSELAAQTRGDFQLSSTGGVFRGLPVSYAAKTESPSRLAAGAAALGNLLSMGKSRKDGAEILSKPLAVAELAKSFAAIPYDQLNFVLSRDTTCETVLKDFSLITPELRLTGGGRAAARANAPLLDRPLAMEFRLRARGRTAELLKYLGKLDTTTDELGYAGCTLPLKVAGTLGAPDPGDLNAEIAALALEKPGVTDKASELINKLLGGSK